MQLIKYFFSNYLFKYQKYLSIFIGVTVLFFVFYIIGCQKSLDFNAINTFDCSADGNVEGVSCNKDANFNATEVLNILGPSVEENGDAKTVIRAPLGRVNLLFVVDDSPSMQTQLQKITRRFDSFLADIKRTDYQISVITTDIKKGGRFLTFSNGKNILSNPERKTAVHTQNVRLFKELIRGINGNNADERGIYVLNQALDNPNNTEFFRPHSLFIAVIVSEEDERSYGGSTFKGNFTEGEGPKELEHYDYPDTFFQKVNEQNKYSLVIVHSIIVKDKQCAKQINGQKGSIYMEASHPSNIIKGRYGNVLEGSVSSICDRDYSKNLENISDTIGRKDIPPFPLPCIPVDGSVDLKVDGTTVRINVEGRQVFIDKKEQKEVKFTGLAKVSFKCI